MSAFWRYPIAAVLVGLTSLAACRPGPVAQPGPVTSPGASVSSRPPATSTPAPGIATPTPGNTPPKMPQQPLLRLNSGGSAVVTLQQRLIALHYFDVAATDGVFGQSTYHAVIAFQKVQGLPRDGIVGPATRARLARPYVPAPRYPLATESLEVNLSRQVVYYIRNGTIQGIIDASTGSGARYYSQGRWARAITPAGRFSIYSRYNGWQAGPLGSLYRPNYFYGGYAVHGMTSVPAYPASHGCVRITVPAMDRMWPSLSPGMSVAIYDS